MEKIKVSIIGATGYSGKELIRILLKHPQVELVHLVTTSYVGKNITEVFPEFINQLDKELIKLNIDLVLKDSDLVFTALPHMVSMDIVPQLLADKRIRVIDLSADFRLKNPDTYARWYKKEHTDKGKELLQQVVYGLPELYKKELSTASLVANPGCYPTSAILGIAPLLAYDLVRSEGIIIDAKSGTSGAGRKLSLGLHFTECNENFRAYKPLKHNHIPEIEQELSLLRGEESKGKKEMIKISFTPHLLPISRGILSTCYLDFKQTLDDKKMIEAYKEFYCQFPFIRIFDPPELPEVRFVEKTNYCDIGFAVDKKMGKIKVISVIDNLTKGASGQAVQNMNLMFDFPEELGLV